MPSLASRSRFGVASQGCPWQDRSPQPQSSANVVQVKKFSTNFPSGESPRPLLDKIQEWAEAAHTDGLVN